MVSLPFNVTDAINVTSNLTSTGLGIAKEVAQGVTGLVPLGGFAFGLEHVIELVVIHLIVIFIFHRVAGLFKSVIIAGGASAILPVVLSKVFGFAIPLTLETFATFAIFGIGIYVVLAVFWRVAIGRASKTA